LLAAIMTLVSAADGTTPAYTQHFIGSTKAPYGFIEHLPAGLVLTDKSTTYPLVFFMHGHGELGDSNNDLPNLAKHGPFKHLVANDAIGKLIDENKAIVIAPQGLKSDNWFKGENLVATLKYVLESYPVDPQRIYVTGLSMGGGGTWTVASAMPDKVAAAMPVCGAGKVANADKLRGIPLWAFHAVDDPTVKFPVSTQAWFDAIFADLGVKHDGGVMGGLDIAGKSWTGTLAGKEWMWKEGAAPNGTLESASVSLTVYPNGGHDSWSRTYANAEVWKWLFAQKKAAAK
jgi:predicted peptidase